MHDDLICRWRRPPGLARVAPYVATDAHEFDARLSPDERRMAFVTTLGGGGITQIMPGGFPGPDHVTLAISGPEGARNPMWRRDGRQLTYSSGPNRFMAPFSCRPEWRISYSDCITPNAGRPPSATKPYVASAPINNNTVSDRPNYQASVSNVSGSHVRSLVRMDIAIRATTPNRSRTTSPRVISPTATPTSSSDVPVAKIGTAMTTSITTAIEVLFTIRRKSTSTAMLHKW